VKRALLAAAIAAAAGCAGPEVAFNSRYEFSKLRRVAVLEFSGPRGTAAADFFAHALLATGADVVERNRLRSLLAEQKLSSDGALAPETARRVGRVLGVDGLFVGSVTRYSEPKSFLILESSSPYVSSPAGPVEGSTRFTRTAALGQSGANVVSSSAQVGLAARLVDVETGSVVWSAHQSYEGFDTDAAMSSISTSFARSLAQLWKAH
jgi:curli biogenesis system outer membrane secretion channel CsgG